MMQQNKITLDGYPHFLTSKQVTEILGVTRKKLASLWKSGKFPKPHDVSDAGTHAIFLKSSVEKFLETGSVR